MPTRTSSSSSSSSWVAVEEKLGGPISWVAVEEKLNMEFAFWRSGYQSQPEEYRELVEGARMKVTDRGLAAITIGKMEWGLAPPSGYTGYCEKLQESEQEDWLLVSRSGFRVTLHSPHGSSGVLQVCPPHGEMEPALDGGVDMSGVVSRFFTSGEVDRPSKLRRTMSQKKHAETLGTKLGAPILTCVNGLRNAIDISDVLNTILGFSAVCTANEHVLQQVPEEPDLDDNYFYDIEGIEESRNFNAERRNASSWVRQQARDAATKCQAAAEATSEVAKLATRMILNIPEPTGDGEQDDPMETGEEFQIGGSSSSSKMEDDAISAPLKHEHSGPPNLDDDLIEFDDWEDRIDASRTPSSGLGRQTGTETSSTSSWEIVRDVEEGEDDILGAGISDAESLQMMLRECDPFGCDDFSHDLVNEFLTLSLGTAPSSSSSHQDQNTDGTEIRKQKVLKRLASWSSSNSGWSSSTERHGPSSVSKKFLLLQLETLAEEPSVDPETASVCRSYVMRAAAMGDVLQWCSCKYNKSRSSIELRFQVGSFMEDDISTLSTGISRSSLLRIEIFLDTTNVRQSLLEGRVRIWADQGRQGWAWNEGTQSVIGLSCYIPHLVRQYLQHSIREQVKNGYEFAGGELLTGLMKHVVGSLVYLKHSCCVCNQQRLPDKILSMVPKPCDQNLCQALHNLWLAVAPQMVVECSTVERWLRTCFHEGVMASEALMLHYMGASKEVWWKTLSYQSKLDKVMAWIENTIVHDSWLQLVMENNHKSDQELRFRADLEAFPKRVDEPADWFY